MKGDKIEFVKYILLKDCRPQFSPFSCFAFKFHRFLKSAMQNYDKIQVTSTTAIKLLNVSRLQKQPLANFLQSSCSWNVCTIPSKTPVQESLFK